ncbi:MAG: tannase/feruloyl esterase family alpha/beta hydrolase [Kordiimonadaceae bacterium]|nr:tannase/feruloyl esterase family alpha/beta hydrolase [Kordiimonadaceae bacterium]
MVNRLLGLILVSLWAACNTVAAYAESKEEAACLALNSTSYETAADSPAVVMSAKYSADGSASLKNQFMYGKRSVVQGIPVGEKIDKLPAHCRVEGYFAPAVKFLMLLPDASDWNSRVLYTACDAFCGAVGDDVPVPGLVKGFATIATDGGHINKRPFDGTWGYNNRQGEIDFGYRATHLAAQLVKVISKDYYGKAHSYAYTTGFSKGGLSGLKSALMFPEDYDGILARAPVVQYQAINAVRMPWLYKSNTRADGTPILLAADTMIIHRGVIAACDALDGVTDGIIDDPSVCVFEPTSLLCKAGENKECLSAEQVTAAEKFYTKPQNDKGETIYPYALAYGSEYDWQGFHAPRKAGDPSFAATIASSFLRYMAFDKDPGPTFDWLAFDPVAGAHKLEAMKHIWDATDPDLRAFKNFGGKMIVLHGLGDGAVNAQMTIDWYESVKDFMGDPASFARLYTIPGSKHGGSPGDGPNVNESMQALINWVEKGTAPEELIFRLEDDDGKVSRTRPAYPYPAITKYKGSGSIDKAENFERAIR